jgi:hypothetical protein
LINLASEDALLDRSALRQVVVIDRGQVLLPDATTRLRLPIPATTRLPPP